MEEQFVNILDQDERVEVVYKPKKVKLFLGNMLLSALIMLFICLPIAFAIATDEYEGAKAVHYLIPVGIFVASQIITALFLVLKYQKTFYAITNKRVIIRTGIVGVDFKSLDLGNIGATDVYVGLLDKILGNKTGSICFGSASSPLNSQNSNAYAFRHVENPYQTYKEIKLKIDEYKNGKAQ